MKPNLLKSNQSKTAVLDAPLKQNLHEQNAEKQVVKEQTPLPSAEKQTEKQAAKQIEKEQHKKNKQSLFKAFDDNQLEMQEKAAYIISPQTEQASQTEEVSEQETEALNQSFVKFNKRAKPQRKQWNFRFKLVSIVYALILSVTVGWVATNAVRLTKAQSSIHLSDIKYAQKLRDLENVKDTQNNQEANLIPWADLIGVQPLPLDDITEYEQQSNWFDSIVNWFGDLFGG